MHAKAAHRDAVSARHVDVDGARRRRRIGVVDDDALAGRQRRLDGLLTLGRRLERVLIETHQRVASLPPLRA